MSASIVAALVGGLLAGCSAGSNVPFRAAAPPEPLTAENWDAVEANPTLYAGRPVDFVGRVIAPFDEDSTPPNVQIFIHPQEGAGVVAIAVPADPGVKPGDSVSVSGSIVGEHTGKGPFMESGVTAVLVQASSVETSAVSPVFAR